MNANELTALISECLREIDDHEFFLKLESVLRQQQAEIEALKLSKKVILKYAEEDIAKYKVEIEALKANRKHDFGLGEASGFIKGHKENPYKAITNTKIEPTVVSYTHPVKEQDTDCQYCKQGCFRCDARKQLTDNEIVWLWCDCEKDGTEATYIKFARAILRKAK